MRLSIILLALSFMSCDPPPPPRVCHLQTVQVQYLAAHPCGKTKFYDGSLVFYEGFCPEECKVVTVCDLWCDQLDAGKVEKHLAHPTVTSNLGSNSVRCDDLGRLVP